MVNTTGKGESRSKPHIKNETLPHPLSSTLYLLSQLHTVRSKRAAPSSPNPKRVMKNEE